VINGVDAQTNSHDAGVIHNWSGRLSPGLPSFSALVAATYGPELPISYISTGGYRETAGIVRYSLLNNASVLRTMLNPNKMEWDDRQLFADSDESRIHRFRRERLQAQMNQANILPRKQKGLSNLHLARNGLDQLDAFADALPDELVSDRDENGEYNPLPRQAQLALIAYQTGMTVSCDLMVSGFDTHDDHDADLASSLKRLTDGITFIFDYAGDLGISDRLVVMVASDFGRTPRYNDDEGKDHWPIGSVLFMQENAAWANRVVGYTDGGHNTTAINPATLQQDDSGTIIYPKHIHQAMRQLAGIDRSVYSDRFPLDAESFDFFNPLLRTLNCYDCLNLIFSCLKAVGETAKCSLK